MRLITKYAFHWLIIRASLLLVAYIIYATSCPIEIHPWILCAFAIFNLLEPLTVLLIALLAENPRKFK